MDRLSRFSQARWPWLVALLCVVLVAGCQDGSEPGLVTGPETQSSLAKKPPTPPPPPPADPAIVFMGKKWPSGDSKGIQVMNADGTNVTTIYPEGARPCWSPNGDAVVFEAGNYYAGTCGIYRMEVSVVNGVPTGTDARRLVEGLVFYPTWSNDGTRIAYVNTEDFYYGDGTIKVEAIPAEGGAREILYTGSSGDDYAAESPTWSPDDTKIALTDGHRIGILDLATHQITTVLGETPLGGPVNLEWACTQDALVFTAGDAIYTMILPDGAPTFIVGGSHRNRAATPAWSPDDSEIVFARDWIALQKINVATGEVTDLGVNGMHPDWRR